MEETLLRAVLKLHTNEPFSIHKPKHGVVEVKLPVYTVRQQAIHVYVRDNGDGTYTLSDQRDLRRDAYQLRDGISDYPYKGGFHLQSSQEYPDIYSSGDSFEQKVGHIDNLAASMFTFAKFINDAMNLAQIEKAHDRPDHTW